MTLKRFLSPPNFLQIQFLGNACLHILRLNVNKQTVEYIANICKSWEELHISLKTKSYPYKSECFENYQRSCII